MNRNYQSGEEYSWQREQRAQQEKRVACWRAGAEVQAAGQKCGIVRHHSWPVPA